MKFTLLSCISLLFFSSMAQASLVVDDPPVDLGAANVLLGSDPTVGDGDIVSHTITNLDVTNGDIFFQFELNETDQSLDLGLGFYQGSTPNGTIVGDTLFGDFDTTTGDLTINSPKTLSGSTNQTSFQWRISGIDNSVLGHEISIDIAIAASNNGPERARFSSVSAVPEPSAFLCMGTVALGMLGRRRTAKLCGSRE